MITEESKLNEIFRGHEELTFVQYGWICPKCSRVYSPYTCMCLYCGKEAPNVSATNPKSIINPRNPSVDTRFGNL